jgi:hypothetical protein
VSGEHVPGLAARVEHYYDDDHDHDDDDNGAAYMRNGPGPFGLSDGDGSPSGKSVPVGTAGDPAASGAFHASGDLVTVRDARAAALACSMVFGMLLSLLIVGMSLLWEAGLVEGWWAMIATPVLVVVYCVWVLPGLTAAAVRSVKAGRRG